MYILPDKSVATDVPEPAPAVLERAQSQFCADPSNPIAKKQSASRYLIMFIV